MPTKLEQRKLDAWAEQCSTHTSGYRDQCNCGVQYYDPWGGWDWAEGELEALEANEAAKAVDGVRRLQFEGKEYIEACECWHKRALAIIGFIESHASIIACYLESERKASIAALEQRLERLEAWSIKDPEKIQIELLGSEKLREIDLE